MIPTVQHLFNTIHSLSTARITFWPDSSCMIQSQRREVSVKMPFSSGARRLRIGSGRKRCFLGAATVTFTTMFVARNSISTITSRQISDIKESIMRLRRHGYQWHSLPGGLDFVTGPKEDTETKERKSKEEPAETALEHKTGKKFRTKNACA
ncbi:uncharacterized protein LY89DRAFT_673218 [Mollisia scopiformis]|uniref:Uncharacterized protein n=1 Tax=Mollisia scopiformis TaxID=149040 RepID=A0A194WYT2_MOLSC|nr:uncharacterized protein LY89DRAFT_673218 [Mollisia scopiformis]KUJ13121.1 hypothetical protein LY89DRAFT_673218 [Mollisia scopiformis]